MTEREQIQHLRDDIAKLIERYRKEYDLTYASVVGVLHITAFELLQEGTDSSPD